MRCHWCLSGDLCYEVHGVYEKSAFKRFMGFIRRAPLWALWPFSGLWTFRHGVDVGSTFMMLNGFTRRVPLCGENLYEVFGVYEVSSFKRFMAFVRKSTFGIFMVFMRRVPV